MSTAYTDALNMEPGTARVRANRFVRLSSGKVVEAGDDAKDIIGVSCEESPADSTKWIGVNLFSRCGLVEVAVGASVSADDLLGADSQGRAVEKTTTGDRFYLVALNSQSTVGNTVEAVVVGSGTV